MRRAEAADSVTHAFRYGEGAGKAWGAFPELSPSPGGEGCQVKLQAFGFGLAGGRGGFPG